MVLYTFPSDYYFSQTMTVSFTTQEDVCERLVLYILLYKHRFSDKCCICYTQPDWLGIYFSTEDLGLFNDGNANQVVKRVCCCCHYGIPLSSHTCVDTKINVNLCSTLILSSTC